MAGLFSRRDLPGPDPRTSHLWRRIGELEARVEELTGALEYTKAWATLPAPVRRRILDALREKSSGKEPQREVPRDEPCDVRE